MNSLFIYSWNKFLTSFSLRPFYFILIRCFAWCKYFHVKIYICWNLFQEGDKDSMPKSYSRKLIGNAWLFRIIPFMTVFKYLKINFFFFCIIFAQVRKFNRHKLDLFRVHVSHDCKFRNKLISFISPNH